MTDRDILIVCIGGLIGIVIFGAIRLIYYHIKYRD